MSRHVITFSTPLAWRCTCTISRWRPTPEEAREAAETHAYLMRGVLETAGAWPAEAAS